MTREEQIAAAARAYEQTIFIDHDPSDVEADFISGAEWADANRWVKVEDGLPEKDDSVNVLLDNGQVDHDWYDKEFNHWAHERHGAKITHWTPIPEPPKAEQ